MSLPPPPSREKLPVANGYAEMPRTWIKWFTDLGNQAASTVAVTWASISKTGSSLTDLETRNHSSLQNLNTADHAHLYLADRDLLVGGGVTTLHKHETSGINYPASLAIGTPTHITDLQALLDHSWSAGITDGCDLTDNGNGTISIAAGNACIRSAADHNAALYIVGVSAQANIALTDDATNYVYLDYNAGAPQFVASTDITAFNGLDKVIAWAVQRSGNLLHWLDGRGSTVDGSRKTSFLFLDYSRFIHAEGGTVLGSPSGLYVSVTAGHFYFMLNKLAHIAFDTSVAGTANANTFVLWNRVAGVFTSTEGAKVVNTTQYDNGTNPTTLGNNKFGVTWFYIVNDTPSELHAVMGQAEYANLASAKVAVPPTAIPTILAGMASLIGFVVYEKSATVFDNVYSAFSQVFTPGFATVHNGLSGLNVGDYLHLTAAQYAGLTGGGDTTLHYHSADRISKPSGIKSISGGGAATVYGGTLGMNDVGGMTAVSISTKTYGGGAAATTFTQTAINGGVA